jgi:hypothetical protein
VKGPPSAEPFEAVSLLIDFKAAGTLRVPQPQKASDFLVPSLADGTRSVPATINSQPVWAVMNGSFAQTAI